MSNIFINPYETKIKLSVALKSAKELKYMNTTYKIKGG